MLPQLLPKIETQHLLTWAICGFRLKSRASNALESKKFSRLHSRTPSRRIAARVLISESDWFALWSAGMILHRVSQAAHSRQRSSAMAIPQGLGCCIHGKMFTGINFFSINIAQNKSTNTEFYRSDWLAKKMSETACPLSAKRTSAGERNYRCTAYSYGGFRCQIVNICLYLFCFTIYLAHSVDAKSLLLSKSSI